VLKNGENRYMMDDANIQSKENAMISQKEFCIASGVVPLPVIFSHIDGHSLALFGYNLGT
jgi:hypothetical protein